MKLYTPTNPYSQNNLYHLAHDQISGLLFPSDRQKDRILPRNQHIDP